MLCSDCHLSNVEFGPELQDGQFPSQIGKSQGILLSAGGETAEDGLWDSKDESNRVGAQNALDSRGNHAEYSDKTRKKSPSTVR